MPIEPQFYSGVQIEVRHLATSLDVLYVFNKDIHIQTSLSCGFQFI